MSKTNKNNTKSKLIPKLRFPEFKDKPQWEVKTIGEVFTTFSGGTPQTKNKDYYGGDIPFIRSAEINSDKTELFITPEGLQNSAAKLVQKGDLLIALYGSNSADSGIAKINGAINQAVLCLRSEHTNEFAHHYITHSKKSITANYLQGGQGNLSGEIIKQLPLPLPSLAEQERIGALLSTLDALIQAQSKEVQLLRLRKKGLMQKMFPYEGETTPEWRFPEFKDAPEWEVKTIGEVVIRNKERNEKLEYSLVQSVSNTYGFINQNQYFNRESLASKDTSRYFVIRKGYFAYNPSRIDVGSLAYKSDDDVSIVSPLYVSFKVKNKLINERYLYSFFNTSNFSKQLIFEGSVRNTLNYEDFSQINLPLPSLAEQERIGALFSTLDSLIEAKSQRLEQLKKHKKGLMQKMFP